MTSVSECFRLNAKNWPPVIAFLIEEKQFDAVFLANRRVEIEGHWSSRCYYMAKTDRIVMVDFETTPSVYRSIVQYNSEFKVLICVQCHSALARFTLARHFRRVHNLKKMDYKPILDAVDDLRRS